MFKKKVEDKKYTSVYNSQANPSTNHFSRDYLSSSMSKAPSSSAFKNSMIKSDFLSRKPNDLSFRKDFVRASPLQLSTGRNGVTTTSTKINDDKFKSYSSSSTTSINRNNHHETTTHTSYEMRSGTSAFSPTFGPTSQFNSKYENGFSSIPTPSFRAPIMPTSGRITSIKPTPLTTPAIYKRPTISTLDIGTRPEMRHLPLKSFMKTNNKGFCVIFNHAKFKNPELNRAGTEHDEKALLEVFRKFNIKCEVKSNYTLDKIKKEIKDLTKKDFSKYACLIIVILSHGGENEKISAYDESYYLSAVITEPLFKNKSLARKAKFFFIQACKGSSSSLVHKNVPLPDSAPVDNSTALAEANLMKCYSTYESRVAYRFSDSGSIFIKTFCEILNQDGHTKHISDIMQAVGRKITSTKELALQVPSVLSTMTANFFFCNLSFEE